MRLKSNATTWGCEHEEQVRREYERVAQQQHIDFSISKSGLVVHVSYPFMGASPDSLINYKCCGYGVLEIKCPYSCCDTSFFEKSKYLKDGELALSVYHTYFPGSGTNEVL